MWKDFASAVESNVRFFGAERKPQMKIVTRLVSDLSQALDEAEGKEEEILKLNIALKKTNAVLTICRAYHQQKDFSSAFSDVETFAQMAPAVDEIPCPDFLHQLRYTHQLEKAEKASVFWPLLSPAEMAKAKFAEADMEGKQIAIISGKLVDITRSDEKSAQANLASWTDVDNLAEIGVRPAAVKDVEHVRVIVTHETATADGADVLDASVAAAKDSSHGIAHALMVHPVGRRLVDAATHRSAELKVSARAARCVLAIVEGLDVVFSGDDLVWDQLVATWKFCDSKMESEIGDRDDVLEKVGNDLTYVLVAATPSSSFWQKSVFSFHCHGSRRARIHRRALLSTVCDQSHRLSLCVSFLPLSACSLAS